MSVNAAVEFGAVLRDARERRGVSLQELADNTKIAASVLRDLEDGTVVRLPGGLYSRAFVRAYARDVGLDPNEMVEAFLQAVPQAQDEFDLNSRHTKSTLGSARNLPIIFFGVALVFLIVAIVWFIFGSRVEPSDQIGEEIEVSGVSLSNQKSLPDTSAEGSTEGIFFSGSERRFTVSVHPTGPCWVALTIDDDRVLARVMIEGERESYEVEHQVVLNVGDAGTFEFSIDEEPGRSLGGDGQVVTVEINQTNHRSFISQR